jgi:hypothetical protein
MKTIELIKVRTEGNIPQKHLERIFQQIVAEVILRKPAGKPERYKESSIPGDFAHFLIIIN